MASHTRLLNQLGQFPFGVASLQNAAPMGALALRTERPLPPPLRPTPVPFCPLVVSLACVSPFLAGPALSTSSSTIL